MNGRTEVYDIGALVARWRRDIFGIILVIAIVGAFGLWMVASGLEVLLSKSPLLTQQILAETLVVCGLMIAGFSGLFLNGFSHVPTRLSVSNEGVALQYGGQRQVRFLSWRARRIRMKIYDRRQGFFPPKRAWAKEAFIFVPRFYRQIPIPQAAFEGIEQAARIAGLRVSWKVEQTGRGGPVHVLSIQSAG